MFEYELNTKLTAEKLMTIPNFKEKFLMPSRGESPETIMNMIQDAYDNNAFSQDIMSFFALPTFEGKIFSWMTTDEFMKFCREIYDVRWGEEIIYWLRIV